MTASAISLPSRLWQLDLLRAAAILLVLGRHPPHFPFAESTPGLALWYQIGWAGVDLFFVLSGFLVGGLLFREIATSGTARVRRFLVRRGWKIYPALAAFLLLTGPTESDVSARDWLIQALYLQNYQSDLPRLWSHTWSLAVEEHFYLLLAAGVAFAIATGATRRVPHAVVVVVAVCLTARLLTPEPFTPITHLSPSHLRLDSLAIGVGLAYLWHLGRVPRWPTWLLASIAVAGWLPIIVFRVSHPFVYGVGLTLLALGNAALIWVAVRRPSSPPVWTAPFTRIGRDSYSIYLWHWPMRFIAIGVAVEFGLPPGAAYLFFILASIGMGIGMAALVERPMLALRDRVTASRPYPIARSDFPAT